MATAVAHCSLDQMLWWILGLTAFGVSIRDGYPWRWEATAVVDSIIKESAVVDSGFEVLIGKKRDTYPRRLEVTVVMDCSVDQSTVVDSGFAVAWVLPRDSLPSR